MRTQNRQPRGIPVGGEFATQVRQPACLVLDLDGVEDPWATPDPDASLASASLAIAARLVGREHRNPDWPDLERAVTEHGASIAQRAYELAGTTPEQVHHRWAVREEAAKQAHTQAREEWLRLDERRGWLRGQRWGSPEDPEAEAWHQEYADLEDAYREAFEASRAADEVHRLVREGRDEATLADVRTLADGYQQALAQVRMLGGTMLWHQRSAPAAVAAFDEAGVVFPADWVEASNARVGGTRRIPTAGGGYREGIDEAPMARLTTVRAHYTDGRTHTIRKRVQVTHGVDESYALALGYDPGAGASTNPRYEFAPSADGRLERTSYLVTSRRPAKRGWERWQHPTDPDRPPVWRKAKVRYEDTDAAYLPEITTQDRPVHAAGRSGSFSACVHESSHRFESTIPDIGHLEAQFVRRRTTDAGTGLVEEARALYPGSGGRAETARADHFVAAYVGKQYPDPRFHEVLSTGTEALFGGEYGGLIGLGRYEPDPDMAAFVLGVLSTAGRPAGHGRDTPEVRDTPMINADGWQIPEA